MRDRLVESACAQIPGLLRSVLVLLPEGILLGGVALGHDDQSEALIRAATQCLAHRSAPPLHQSSTNFVEYLFVIDEQLIIIQRGRSDARLALAVVCTQEANMALVLSATRKAIATLEAAGESFEQLSECAS